MPDPATPPENKPAAPPQPRRSPRLALLAAIVLPATLLLGMLWLLASEAGLGALAHGRRLGVVGGQLLQASDLLQLRVPLLAGDHQRRPLTDVPRLPVRCRRFDGTV